MNTATIIAFVISLIIQVGFPLVVILHFRRRTHAPWRVFGYGLLIYAVFQLFTWLPLSVYLDATLGAKLTSGWGAFLWLLALALVTSLVEEGGRWLGYRFLFTRSKIALTWENGIMYGLGHGSMEMMLLIAGLTFIYFVAYVVLGSINQGQLLGTLKPIEALEVRSALSTILNTTWDQPIVVAIERVLTLPHQLAWSLMVLASYISRRKRWFLFAVLYHWSIAVIVPGLVRLFGFAVAECVNAAFCALSIWIIVRLRILSPVKEHLI
ncbi:MAG: YhfC family glutamic-type intramembrane protease [Anaerolineae bacterium]